jgi:hypothetical protein
MTLVPTPGPNTPPLVSVVTLYDLETGRLLGTISGTPASIAENTPVGVGVYAGALDLHEQRIDVATGEPVAWQPPRPDSHAVWHAGFKRWFNRADLNRKVQNLIEKLEKEQQPRALRDAVLGGNRNRLRDIQDSIATLRVRLLQAEDTRSAAEILAAAKEDRIEAIRAEALTRMGEDFAALSDPDMVLVLRELWLSIAPAARQPTAKMTKVFDVYQAATSAVATVRAALTVAAVAAVVVAWP